jgi:organic hydroperoxide reductase OsmC/OhrA
MSEEISVTVTRQSRYQFVVDFSPIVPPLVADEPPPIGDGTGPSPTQLLAAAMANCLSSSLVFAATKYKEDPGPLTTTATCIVDRNEKNRLRVIAVNVTITLGNEPQSPDQLQRALAQFEDFCTVSQSVRAGIPLSVTIRDHNGRTLR